MPRGFDDLSSLSMLDLFRVEAENQTAIMTSGLLELERGRSSAEQLETLMRAAHSLKGAARIVNIQAAVRVAHAMEDCFVAAQHGKLQLHQPEIDVLLRGVDLLLSLAKRSDAPASNPGAAEDAEVSQFLASLTNVLEPSQLPGEKRKRAETSPRPQSEKKHPKPAIGGAAAEAKEAAITALPVIALEEAH